MTTNSGLSWSRWNLTGVAGYAYALAVQPGNSNIVYAGGTPGIYKTTNQGTSWNNISAGIADTVFDIAINPGSTNIVYAASKAGIYKSTNGGGLWSNLGYSPANAVIIDPLDNNKIYAGTGNGVFISTNAGSTWAAMNQGLGNLLVKSLAINPNAYLFAGTEGTSAYRWQLNVGIEQQEINHLIALQCWPVIVSDQLNIQYELLNPGYVKITVYDIQGRSVHCLDQGPKPAGEQKISWLIGRGKPRLSRGVFFIVLDVDGYSYTKKILLID